MSEADGRYVNQDGGVKMAKPVMSGVFGQGAVVGLGSYMRPRKRDNIVKTLGDWPRGTRKRKWGFLHDQLWFPDEPKCFMHQLEDAEDVEGYHWRDRIWRSPDGKLWRKDAEGEWLRLYMDRRQIWLRWLTLRIHTFYSGDDDSAPHDHPWWFITFPLSSYREIVECQIKDVRGSDEIIYARSGVPLYPVIGGGLKWTRVERVVRRFLPHFRRGTYRHIVKEPDRPFKTLVISGHRARTWGFWPIPTKFVPWTEWAKYE